MHSLLPSPARRRAHPPGRARRTGLPRGFTALESLVVVALIGILASIAYPSLRAPLLRARRGDAQLALMQLQLAQERWRGSHNRYGTLADTGSPAVSPLGHYRLTVEAPGASSFELLAEAVGAQADDIPCRVLRLSRVDGRTRYSSGPDAHATNPHDTNRRCWNQ